ncbi:MAG: hypothetical protein E6K44_05740 [Gammaproteobacteria bacterium]|nr:MAG: hypothetical protein E6K44_05740 [Gammaproteobacteria bacterium]
MQDTTIKATARSIGALLAGAALIAAASLLPATLAGAADKPTNSAKLAKPLKEANDDIKAKKYADAIGKLKEAEGIAGKTAYDQHLINDMLAFAYARTQNYAEAAKAWEAELDDGFMPQSDIPTKVRQLAEANYQIKNYDKAIEFGNRAIKGGFADEELRTLVGQAYYLKGDWKGTLRFEEGLIDSQVKDGKTPKKESLELALSACVKLNDSPCETRALERIVTYYPKPDYWYQLLYTLRQQTSGNDANTLEKDADAASTGAKNFGVGLAYLGYGQYDKAVDQISKGLAKGGLRNEAEGRLLLGIAQLKAGHKEDATKSFHAVKGDPSLERLANLWSLHAKQA